MILRRSGRIASLSPTALNDVDLRSAGAGLSHSNEINTLIFSWALDLPIQSLCFPPRVPNNSAGPTTIGIHFVTRLR